MPATCLVGILCGDGGPFAGGGDVVVVVFAKGSGVELHGAPEIFADKELGEGVDELQALVVQVYAEWGSGDLLGNGLHCAWGVSLFGEVGARSFGEGLWL